MSLTDDDVRRLAAALADEIERRRPKRRSERPRRGRVERPHESPPSFTVNVSGRNHSGPCVYVLLLNGAFVYVGKTSLGFAYRCDSHSVNKRFDTVVTLDVEADRATDEWLYALEEAVCDAVDPVDNCRSALRRQSRRLVNAWAERLGDIVERIREALAAGQGVTSYASSSTAAEEVRAFVDELEALAKRKRKR